MTIDRNASPSLHSVTMTLIKSGSENTIIGCYNKGAIEAFQDHDDNETEVLPRITVFPP